ncbi:MAG TPA: hypothetical protein PLY56_08650 [Armatimonadota bacterium]|nr:hypothetical protein [Armatimonadota bacterium]
MAEPGTPRWFLEALFADMPGELYLLIWTLADKRSRWFRDLDAAAAAVEALASQDVYVGVGLSTKDYGPTQRCPSEEIVGVVAAWADFDILSEAHPKKSLPSTLEQALSVVPPAMPPSIVISTGNGAHAWWILREPYLFDSDEDRRWAASVVLRWQTLLRYNAANRGWAFDRLADLARVLRIPGTLNCKDPAHPKSVTVYQVTDRRYNLSDLEEYLDELGIEDPEAHEQKRRAWAERFKDKPIIVNLKAELPEDLVRRLVDADLRFRNTWFRQRHDLKDQSQSGYDLALADFGMDAGLSEQQIVDLIIQHRRMHRQKARTRADYYERTLAKAAQRSDAVRELPPLCQATADASATDRPAEQGVERTEPPEAKQERPSDAMAAKAALCEYISQILGVRILRIVKITGKEPTYQLILENAKIELAHVGKLLDQNSVRMAIATATNKLIKRLKPKLWDQLAQSMLDALIEEEGGPETQLEGAMRMYLEQYLTDVAFIPAIEGQSSNAIRRPMVLGGQIAVNSSDLQLFINKTFLQNLSVKAVASMLAAVGAKSIRVRSAKNGEQGRWLLPADQFNPADYTAPAKPEEAGDAKAK